MAMRAQLPPDWYSVVEIGWAIVTLGGMAIWVWTNDAGLEHEKRRTKRTKWVSPQSSEPQSRDSLLTPIQRHFLEVSQACNRNED
jgi:hypothetical protein